MTRLLEKAIEGARTLPDEEQDALALAIMTMTEHGLHVPDLDDETRAAIQDGLEQVRARKVVSDEEMAALWRRFGV